MIQILVTGADGQLGQCLRKIENQYPEITFAFYNSKQLDITDEAGIQQVLATKHFDYCINCAAYTNVEQAEQTPALAFAINSEAVQKLAKGCLAHDCVLIHVSTDYVFDGAKNEPYGTSDATNPINIYGKSKLAGEQHIQEILNRYFVIRTSWLYSEFGKNFYKTIVQKAETEEVLTITTDQTGCPTNANNLATYMMKLIQTKSEAYGIHHFTDGEAMTWYGFAKKILLENKLQDKVRLEKAQNYRTLAARPKNSVLQ